MILTLEASSATGRELPAPRSMVFRARGGTIGRTTGNDWVLPDPYVSSRHARIVYEHGTFYVEDTSTNGVFLNSPDRRVGRGNRAELSEGDVILIEPYEIRVSLEAGESAIVPGAISDDPFGLPEPASVDPLQLFGGPSPPAKAPASDVRGLANKPVISESFKPPAVIGPPPSAAGLIPTDYDPMNSSRLPRPVAEPHDRTPPSVERPVADPPASEPTYDEPPKRRAPAEALPAKGPAGGFADVLAGAGLGNFPVSPEIAREFGQILRVVVTGLMDVLNARQQLKQEFRMPVTTVQASENNPLKFSANVEDALHNLLVKRNPAYLGPLPAFEDAFADVRLHQMAMLHGVRAAFESMLKEFDPDRLQKEFDRKSKGSVMPGKLRYWDQYRERFGDMVSDADACFRDLFGDEFATAYEDQLVALKADSKGGAGRRRPRS
jgi:type VI secretion system protein ImpI